MNKDELLEELHRIREFQIKDLWKADEADANFLACVGCLNATEVLGGIQKGLIGLEGYATKRLEGGIELLGGVYQKHREDILSLRHSMIHAYLGKTKKHTAVHIGNKHDLLGIRDPKGQQLPLTLGIQIVQGKFIVNVSVWIYDLERAWQRLMEEITASDELSNIVADKLEKLPLLL